MRKPDVTVIGGGLAGCEAAWQLAERGLFVALVEQKPARMSPAHATPLLAELVCSNSLRGDEIETPAGLLKAELRGAGSLILRCADETRVPAGGALAVDRVAFSRLVTVSLALHPRMRIERRPVENFPDAADGPVILAGGPLVGGGLSRELKALCGDRFYFYDAIAPIVDADTIDWDKAFIASRYGKGKKVTGTGTEEAVVVGADDSAESQGDYVNCPMTKAEYDAFVRAIREGRKITPHRFEEPKYFDGCLPIEVMAERGDDVLAFGPMKPVGLDTNAHAVVQLRLENRHGTSYNMVGFQTRLAYPEQKRIFAMIPALANAEFLRYGSIHRNSYIESWRLLGPQMELRQRPWVQLAGQITGVEGYIESTAMGLLAAQFLARRLAGLPFLAPPDTTAFGALYQHILHPRVGGATLSPANINYGLFPALPGRHRKPDRRRLHAERAQRDFATWANDVAHRANA